MFAPGWQQVGLQIAHNAKIPGLHLREARNKGEDSGSVTQRRTAAPQNLSIILSSVRSKEGGSLTFNSVTLNPVFIHAQGNF